MYEDLKIDGLPFELRLTVRQELTAAYRRGRADGVSAEKTDQINRQLKLATDPVTIMANPPAPTAVDLVQANPLIEAIKRFTRHNFGGRSD